MTLTKKQQPYEFLARWDHQTGAYKGAHVGFMTVIEEDGVVISIKQEAVQPVATGVGNGFPLGDILQTVQITALARCEELEAAVADLNKKLADSVAATAALQAELSTRNVGTVG